MKQLTLGLLILIGAQSWASKGAVKFKSMNEASASGFYRLTCSDAEPQDIQAAIYLEVKDKAVTALKIVSLAPAESLIVLLFSDKDVGGLKIIESTDQTRFYGTRPGATVDEDIELTVKESTTGQFEAQLSYDDNDGGVALSRKMKCGAVNYLLAPSR